MSDNSDRELEALRRSWDRIQAPEPFRALAEEDAATQQAVAWLQGALQSIAPAKPAARAPRRWPMLRLLTLAAAVLLILMVRQDQRPAVEPWPPSVTASLEPSIEVLNSSRDRLELRSGLVRLTLLHSTPTPVHP